MLGWESEEGGWILADIVLKVCVRGEDFEKSLGKEWQMHTSTA